LETPHTPPLRIPMSINQTLKPNKEGGEGLRIIAEIATLGRNVGGGRVRRVGVGEGGGGGGDQEAPPPSLCM
jgi:hypothetical protein